MLFFQKNFKSLQFHSDMESPRFVWVSFANEKYLENRKQFLKRMNDHFKILKNDLKYKIFTTLRSRFKQYVKNVIKQINLKGPYL